MISYTNKMQGVTDKDSATATQRGQDLSWSTRIPNKQKDVGATQKKPVVNGESSIYAGIDKVDAIMEKADCSSWRNLDSDKRADVDAARRGVALAILNDTDVGRATNQLQQVYMDCPPLYAGKAANSVTPSQAADQDKMNISAAIRSLHPGNSDLIPGLAR